VFISIDLQSHSRGVRTIPWRPGERNGKEHRLVLRREFGFDTLVGESGPADSNYGASLITSDDSG